MNNNNEYNNYLISKEDVDTYMCLHDKIEGMISEVIRLHGIIADESYGINFKVADKYSGFFVYVEYYKYQDLNHDMIYVESKILHDEAEFCKLKEKSEKARLERNELRIKAEDNEMQRKLKEARELIEKYEKNKVDI